MISTRQKTIVSVSLVASPATVTDVATQTEGSGKHTDIQVLGCRVCPSLLSVSNSSSSGYACGRCAQVEELFSQVAELQEEVSRLRSIREPGKLSRLRSIRESGKLTSGSVVYPL